MPTNVAAERQSEARRPTPGAYARSEVYIAGAWRAARSDELLPVHDSGTEEILGDVRSADAANVDEAVAAAEAALPTWSATPPTSRSEQLLALHAALAARADELVSLISAEVGTAARMCGPIQVASSLNLLELTAKLLLDERFEEQVVNSLVVRREVGVVAAITPWNYPLFQTIGKVAAALAAGCTIVHKPSELAPLSSFVLAESFEATDFPPGVYNLVPGRGPAVGEQLATHPTVRMVSFTGSTAAGRRVYELAARSIKRVALELGGKSASVLFEDADLEAAVKTSVNRAFINSGQTCDAWTRLLVPRRVLDEVLDLAVVSAQRLKVGDPFDDRTRLGPLVSRGQVDRVRGYVDGALGDGAVAVLGGSGPPDGLAHGYYVAPTILRDVEGSMRIAREEVFGPVLAVMSYDSEDDALQLANSTEYGLSGAVWSTDHDRAMQFARRMQTGQVVINGGRFNPRAPFGGINQSGIGRELGRYGIEEFLETTALQS
jgi:aldehyde dehydrogenase (NAD+)